MGPLFFGVTTFAGFYGLFRTVEGACDLADSAINKYIPLPTTINLLHPTGGSELANGVAKVTFINKDERTLWHQYTLVLVKAHNGLYGTTHTQPSELKTANVGYVHQFLYTWYVGAMPTAEETAQRVGKMIERAVRALSDEDKNIVSRMFSMLNQLEREGRVVS